MPDRLSITPVKPVRCRILLPLIVTLLIFLGLFSLGAREFMRRSHERSLDLQYQVVQGLFRDLIAEQERSLGRLLDQLSSDESLRQAVSIGDRDTLLAVVAPKFEALKLQGVTHFYLHDADGINVLRAHEPLRHGDRIRRYTLQQAMTTRNRCGGLELGPLGTFTLRVVQPWAVAEGPPVFLELGTEVAPLFDRVKTLSQVELFVTLSKDHLQPSNWSRGMQLLGREPAWGQFPTRVLLEQTHEGLAEKIAPYLNDPYLAGQKLLELKLDEHRFAGRFLPLTEVSGERVGEMLVLLDAGPFRAALMQEVGLTVLFCLIFGIALVWTSTVILGRFDRQLLATHGALEASHRTLEERVEERTRELGRHNRLLQGLIANIPDMVAWKDSSGIYRGGNPKFLDLVGLSEDATLAGRSDSELKWPAEIASALAGQAAAIEARGEAQLDREVMLPAANDSGPQFLTVSSVPIGDRHARQGVLILLRDITGHKLEDAQLEQAYAEVQTSRDRLKGILASISDALFVTDGQDRMLMLNASAEKLFATSSEKAIGRPITEVIRLPWLAAGVQRALRRRPTQQQFDAVWPGNTTAQDQVFQVRTSVIEGGTGASEGVVFAARDVSEERRIDRLKSQFISTAAHELRTPLTVVFGFAELLLENEFPPEQQREYLQLIFEKAETMSDLLDDLLDLSRLEAGRPLKIKLASIQAHKAFSPNTAVYRQQAPSHRFVVDLAEAEVQVDAGKISQVLDNLISNAVKYSPQGGQVSVLGEVTEQGYCVSVSDEGIGMTEAQRQRAFEKFYRADSSNTAVAGTGLGLTIAEHIIKTHGGRIWIDSVPQQGTTVSFLLPWRTDSSEAVSA